MIERNKILNQDCLIGIKEIEDNSVDLICTDPPYKMTPRGNHGNADSKFNELYYKWIETNDKWIKPSLDHIKAKCNGGSLLIDNLQFISWLENRAKIDIDQELWNKMKQNINYYL